MFSDIMCQLMKVNSEYCRSDGGINNPIKEAFPLERRTINGEIFNSKAV